jgi:hypothetical protein
MRDIVYYDVYVTHGGGTDKNACDLGPTPNLEAAINMIMNMCFRVIDIKKVVFRDQDIGAIAATMERTDEPRDCRISRPGREVEIRRASNYSGYPGSGRQTEGKMLSTEELREVMRDGNRRRSEQN